MNMPPPPGGWPNQPPGPTPGQPQYGPPTGQQPYAGQQPHAPQAHWPQQPPPPPPQKGGGAIKWLLVAIAVLLVIGVTIGATLLFTRGNGDGPSSPPTSGNASDIASANDTGPVSIITEEPTCEAFLRVNDALADLQTKGWSENRGELGPRAEWTPQERTQVESVATALRNAADQVEPLVAQTPHRVVRELYVQFAGYGRAYADSIDDYTPADDNLASANVNASSALVGICNSIEYGAITRALTLDTVTAPSSLAPFTSESGAQLFVTNYDDVCNSWTQRERAFIAENAPWETLDPNTPATDWSPQQRQIQDDAEARMTNLAVAMEQDGRSSGNPELEDFAVLGSLYLRAYAAAGDSYNNADSWLSFAGLRLNNMIGSACDAAKK